MFNPFTVFGPTIEPPGVDRFLTDLPENLPPQDVPTLFSYTQHDGLYPSAEYVTHEQTLVEMESKWNEILPFLLDYNNTVSDESLRPEIAQKIKTFYFGNNSVSVNTKNNVIEVRKINVSNTYNSFSIEYNNIMITLKHYFITDK